MQHLHLDNSIDLDQLDILLDDTMMNEMHEKADFVTFWKGIFTPKKEQLRNHDRRKALSESSPIANLSGEKSHKLIVTQVRCRLLDSFLHLFDIKQTTQIA